MKKQNSPQADKIKSLIIKGFSNDEIVKLLKVESKDVDEARSQLRQPDSVQDNASMIQDSINLYSEMQKDIAKQIMLENQKELLQRDSNVILGLIKLQTELQQKKLDLLVQKQPKFNELVPFIERKQLMKDSVLERDKDMAKMAANGSRIKDIAKKMETSETTVKQAIDRVDLIDTGLSPAIASAVGASVISETRGLDKLTRINLIRHAAENKLSKNEVRDIVTRQKNEVKK